MMTRSTARDLTPLRRLLIISFAVAAAITMSSCFDDGSSADGAGTEGGGDEPVANTAGTLGFSSADYYAVEDEEQLEITVSRSGGDEGMVSVLFETADGTAVAGSDYVAKDGYLRWEDGESGEKSFFVGIMNPWPDDEVKEFSISLASASGGAAIGEPAAAGISIGMRVDDPCCDAAAWRFTSFSGIYEGIARNPEVGGDLIDDAELLAGITGEDKPCCGAQAARARSVGMQPLDFSNITDQEWTFNGLVGNISRQPEVWGSEEDPGPLRTGFPRLSGSAPESPCCEARAARLDAVGGLIYAIARNADAQSTLETAFAEMNGPLELGQTCTAWPARWMASVGSVLYGIGRQPELEDTLTAAFRQFAGAGPSDERKLQCDAQAGRMEAFAWYFESLARYPGVAAALRATSDELLGPVADTLCSDAVVAGQLSLKKLYESIARNPETAATLVSDARNIAGITAVESPSCEVETARLESLMGFYDGVGRNPSAFSELVTAVEAFTDEPIDASPCCEAQAARAATVDDVIVLCGSLTYEAALELLGAFERFAGPAPASPCCEAMGARMDAAGRLTELCAIATTEQCADEAGEVSMKPLFWEYNGPLVEDPGCQDQWVRWIAAAGSLVKSIIINPHDPGHEADIIAFFQSLAGSGPPSIMKRGCLAQTARMEAYGRIFEGLHENDAWDVENLPQLLAIADDYLGPVSKPLCDEAIEEAQRSLMKLYVALARQPDKEDAYLAIAEQMGAPLETPICGAE